MDNCLGVLINKNIDNNFGRLCENRPSYMLPYGGRYRLIDIAISNLVNNGVKSIALYTGEKVRSTIDHLGDGKPWELNRRFSGLSLFPPSYEDRYPVGNLRDIDQLYSTELFFESSKEKYVFIGDPNTIAKVNLSEAYKKFINSNADITFIFKEQDDPRGDYVNYDKIHVDCDGKFTNMGLNLGIEKIFNLSMGMYFIKKEVLLSLINGAIEKGNGNSLKETIIANKNRLKINTYEFKGHVEFIDDLISYYKANLNLLEPDIYKEVFFHQGIIYTKAKDEPPTIYKKISKVQNSVIANGCVIEGVVENSILFRGVKVGRNAIIKNSILMQKSEVADNAVVMNSIIDKFGYIGKEVVIAGSPYIPYVVQKRGTLRKD